jgi:large subunit ribosomal protein L17
MRHRVAGRQLGRTSAHRRALRRNLAQSLIEHETISTTIEKAKEVKPFVEKLITLAKKGKLQHRRQAISLLGNRNIVGLEDGEPVKKGTVVGKLFSELGPRYLDRPGGYTRIVRLSLRRLGDNGQLVLLQLLGADEPLKKERKTPGRRRSRKKAKAAPETPAPVETEAAEEEETADSVAQTEQEPQEQPVEDGEAGAQEQEEPK